MAYKEKDTKKWSAQWFETTAKGEKKKRSRRGIYSGLLLSGKLKEHLLMIQEQADNRFDLLVEQLAEQEGVTEQLKEQDQMLWVKQMNNIRERAEEIVRKEIIYCL